MKKHYWKTEYSITLIVFFAVILFIVPASMFTTSKQADYISRWNEAYAKVDYVFTAMSAQADTEIIKGVKFAKTPQEREQLLIQLIQPYLRLEEHEKILSHYHPHYMNGARVKKSDEYYFDNLYISDSGYIVGIKDLPEKNADEPALMLMVDVNGLRHPNRWGEDIYGILVYRDGQIRSIGYNWDIEKLKKDCNEDGRGVSCSHYYRIGGEFNG